MTPDAVYPGIAGNCAGAVEKRPDGPNPDSDFLNALNGGLNEIKRCLVALPQAIRARAAVAALLAGLMASCGVALPFRKDPPPELSDWYECLGKNRDGSGGFNGTEHRDEVFLLLVVGRARDGQYGDCSDSSGKPTGEASRLAPGLPQERKSNEQDN